MLVFRSTALAVVVVWVFCVAWLWHSHDESQRDAVEELNRTVAVAAEHMQRVLTLGDLFLDWLEPIAARESPDKISDVLHLRISRLVSLDSSQIGLAFVDRRDYLFPHHVPPYPPVWVGDRHYQREAVIGRMTVCPPVLSRDTGHWVLPLVRRVGDPASAIAVMIVANDLSHIEDYYETIRHGAGSEISLFRTDGILLARSPYPPDGRDVLGVADPTQFLAYRDKGEGKVISISSPVDGGERLLSFREIKPYGVAVAVSFATREAMASWWRQVWLVLIGGFGCTMAIGVSAVLIGRLLGRLEVEARSLEGRVLDRTEALNLLLKRREEFLTAVSHELRTPLNAILGFSDALIQGVRGALSPGQVDYLADIHRSGKHLLALVNDLLDSAAIDAGSLHLDEGDLDIGEIVTEAVRLVASFAEQGGVVLSVMVEPGLIVRGDRRRLLQAVLNLCSNAVKYSRRGGRVEVSAALGGGGECLLAVNDDGIGMSADQLSLALRPFGRAGKCSVGPDEGTGLGLPLSIGIIELHGGSLTLKSALGQGTRALIRLPAQRVRLAA